jgi:hypothetical protein
MFPSRQDLEEYVQHERWTYQPLMDRLARDGQASLNLGPALLDGLGDRPPARLFKLLHYTEEGNRLVAGALAQALGELAGQGVEIHSVAQP